MKKDTRYQLTDEDLKILGQSREDGRYFGDFYLRKPGAERGFVLDHDMHPPWQLAFHHADQRDICAVCGVGVGKTICCAVSAVTWCCTSSYFKFLNVAPLGWQANQMFESLLPILEDTLCQKRFTFKWVRKPFPRIIFRHSGIGESIMEFMSLEGQGEKILTYEGDWINVDQAEQVDDLDELITNLRTRLRGTTVDGRARLGRLSLIANANENMQLWYRFGLAEYWPEEYLSINVPTMANQNLTERQVRDIVKNVPEEDRERVLGGHRPEGGGKEFSVKLVEACEDESLDMVMAANKAKPGFTFREAERSGVVQWELPYDPARMYVLLCDPGQGNPPHRNAPVISVMDVTDFPDKPAVERAFWWGFGNGMYDPFVNQFLEYAMRYNCIHLIYDSTGGQKAFAEFPFKDLTNVIPMDTSGIKKQTFHISLKLLMAKGLLKWAQGIKGRRHQFLQYVLPEPRKLPQDIVSVYQLFGGYAWYHLGYFQEQSDEEVDAWIADRYGRAQTARYSRPLDR